ncbi:GNAT family N-acetyltransferase [Psychrobacillus sp. OK032]|uniref:GNAT family N-acetyltransferase n=1 Tax=Psychrobacillus sp. OK032 TaxID=1884358 RepID=UPI0008C92427|nr:GNAT family N-acetyltransferase [Psychrobacillus sp. OK032]SES11049.1 Ribosomal protein S18 acetylase RimI [Psychrobacillus sp. OK032]
MLTQKQLEDIKQLQQECETHDHLQLKLNWDMLSNREFNEFDFFHYENDELVAFLGLYPFGSTVEVCGMVKPIKRRKGHFSRLLQQGLATAKYKHFKKILLNAPASSVEAKLFLTKLGANYEFSEHQMEWKGKNLEEVDGFTLRKANIEDLEMRIRLDIEAFGITIEDAQEMENRIVGDSDNAIFMIDVHEEPVGKIRVKKENGEAWIYGFSILPTQQGQGIGRKVLQRVVKEQSEAGHSVHLEVETTNAHALGLYQSVGFIVTHAQDYYFYPSLSSTSKL